MPSDGTERDTRLMLARRTRLTREGMRLLLANLDGFTLVGEADTTAEAVVEAERVLPDVIISSVDPPVLDPIDLARHFSEMRSSVAVVVVTRKWDPAYIRRALHSPIAGYIARDIDGFELVTALRAVRCGFCVTSSEVMEIMRRQDAGQPYPGAQWDPSTRFTRRQREVIELMTEGLSNKEIADRLGIGVRTVEMHVAHDMTKLGARSRTDMVVRAIDLLRQGTTPGE
ncbi:MAG: response regulator transcription factor [Chloroflexi bacterium]|nr:response regulator transcription factor [Chloroflexota bacterium]